MTQQEVEHACAPDTEHCSCVPHLRAEIERLRRQRVLSNEDFTRAFDRGLVAGEKRATERIVAYLRERQEYTRDHHIDNAVSGTYGHAADHIERGEHRREEER